MATTELEEGEGRATGRFVVGESVAFGLVGGETVECLRKWVLVGGDRENARTSGATWWQCREGVHTRTSKGSEIEIT